MEDPGYVGDPALVTLIPGVSEALRQLKTAGYELVIITNQSGIGRGKFTEKDFEAVQVRLCELLGSDLISATYMCPDVPGTPSLRRKPSPEMILEAGRDLDLDLPRSWMIGDKEIDVQCGNNAGTGSILVLTGQSDESAGEGANYVAQDLHAAVHYILQGA